MNPTSPQNFEPPTIQDRDHQCAASFFTAILPFFTEFVPGGPDTRLIPGWLQTQSDKLVCESQLHGGIVTTDLWRDSETALNVQLLSRYSGRLCCRLSGRGDREDPLSTWRRLSETLGCACPTWQIRGCHVLLVDIPLCRHCPDPENLWGPRNKRPPIQSAPAVRPLNFFCGDHTLALDSQSVYRFA
jgi:hypothetical protein